ncbi:MAG: flagellar M-ring protein FliF [Clostridia bacterium]|nr:flagellar M-ring protein FliF [Clostridia bacterium]
MDVRAQILEQINNLWQKLSKWQRASILIIVVLFIIMIIAILLFNKPQMEILYSGLSPENASAITAKLKEENVPYQLTDEGTTILVSAKDKYQLRLDMASEINLSGVVGFESFNETRFGETDTDKQVRFLVALQGELTRTIEHLDAVETAKVHIALPQPSLFIRDEKEATASVLLRLKPYASLTPGQVKSIMSFVSHSVEGLKPENVTVMDVNGNLLSENLVESTGDTAYISANQLALKQEYEKKFAQSIQTMLEEMRGAGKAIVRASISMDFDRVETHSEKYMEPVVRSEQIREESSSGNSQTVGGNPADENMAGPSYGGTGSGSSEYELTETTTNYEVGKTIETKIAAPGKITNISLAVIINGELIPEEESKIKDAVAKAAGINTERGDQITVVGIPFNNEDTTKLEEALAKRESYLQRMEIIKMLRAPLIILLLIGITFFVVRRIANRDYSSYAETGPQEVAAINNDELGVELDLTPEALEKKNLQKQIDNIVRKNPEEVAKVIKTWLAEE